MKATERAARYEAALRQIVKRCDILGTMIVERSREGLEVNEIAIAHWEALFVAAGIAYKALPKPEPKPMTRAEEKVFNEHYPDLAEILKAKPKKRTRTKPARC